MNNLTNSNLYQEGIQNVMKSVILYSTTFRRIAGDLIEMYSGEVIKPYDYTVLFINFYDRTNQLIEAISGTMADVIRRTTTQDAIRSKTTNALKRELLEDSFYYLNDNLQRFKVLMNELGIAIEAKASENAFNATVLTAGTIGAVLSGTRKMSYIDGMAMAALATQNHQNSQQMDVMRRQKVDSALAAMVTTTSLLNDLTIKLMDQYISLIYGGNVNLAVRDQYLSENNEEINKVVNACNQISFFAKEIYEKSIIYSLNYRNTQKKKNRNKVIKLLLFGVTITMVSIIFKVTIIVQFGLIFTIIFAVLTAISHSVSIKVDVENIKTEIIKTIYQLRIHNENLEKISLRQVSKYE